MRGPEPNGIQEPAFLPSSLSHLSRHHKYTVFVSLDRCTHKQCVSLVLVLSIAAASMIRHRRQTSPVWVELGCSQFWCHLCPPWIFFYHSEHLQSHLVTLQVLAKIIMHSISHAMLSIVHWCACSVAS